MEDVELQARLSRFSPKSFKLKAAEEIGRRGSLRQLDKFLAQLTPDLIEVALRSWTPIGKPELMEAHFGRPPVGPVLEELLRLDTTASGWREAAARSLLLRPDEARAHLLLERYPPFDARHKALLLLMAGRIDEYAELDFDHEHLKTLFTRAPASTRSLLLSQLSRHGRSDVVTALASRSTTPWSWMSAEEFRHRLELLSESRELESLLLKIGELRLQQIQWLLERMRDTRQYPKNEATRNLLESWLDRIPAGLEWASQLDRPAVLRQIPGRRLRGKHFYTRDGVGGLPVPNLLKAEWLPSRKSFCTLTRQGHFRAHHPRRPEVVIYERPRVRGFAVGSFYCALNRLGRVVYLDSKFHKIEAIRFEGDDLRGLFLLEDDSVLFVTDVGYIRTHSPTGKVGWDFVTPGQDEPAESAFLNRLDGQLVVVTPTQVTLWETEPLSRTGTLPRPDGWVTAAAFAPTGEMALGTASGEVALYSAGGTIESLRRPARISALTIADTGIVVAEESGEVSFWLPRSGKVRTLQGTGGSGVEALAIHEEGVWLMGLERSVLLSLRRSLDETPLAKLGLENKDFPHPLDPRVRGLLQDMLGFHLRHHIQVEDAPDLGGDYDVLLD